MFITLLINVDKHSCTGDSPSGCGGRVQHTVRAGPPLTHSHTHTLSPLFYIFLEPIGFGYIQVLLFSQMFCITFSFFTNKYFVFKTKGNVKEEYLRFFAFYGFYLLLNLLCLPFLVEVIQITPILAQTLFSFAIIVSSYFWHNLVTFKQTKESL